IRITLDREGETGRSELFIGTGFAPSPTNHDLRVGQSGGPDVSLDVSPTQPGSLYILAKGSVLGVPRATYHLTAETFDFQVFHVSPESGGNTGQVTAYIAGQGIPFDATAML